MVTRIDLRYPRPVKHKRPYRQDRRAETVRETRDGVLAAAYQLFLVRHYDDVSLQAVAERAGVSKQTVIRQFGSKDRLAVAVVDWQRPREETARAADGGDVGAAVAALVARYEVMGDANVRMLQLESRVPAVRHLLAESRDSHRSWVERTFAEHLPRRAGPARQRRTMAFYAATDVMLWKLFRRDFRLGRAATEAVVRDLVAGLVATSGRT